MSKIMLVEDDDSLREIYSIRLTAEGYTIVSARDGEEALAVAVRERPDLVVSDVMMPKISGFDMLDILRSTPETQDIKVIMMTALSSEDQRLRGESLGADRYLVKSQVGIEDVVNAVHEVLGDRGANGVIAAASTEGVPTASGGTGTTGAGVQGAGMPVTSTPGATGVMNAPMEAGAMVAGAPAMPERPVASASPAAPGVQGVQAATAVAQGAQAATAAQGTAVQGVVAGVPAQGATGVASVPEALGTVAPEMAGATSVPGATGAAGQA